MHWKEEQPSLCVPLWKHLHWLWLEQRALFHLQKAFVRIAPVRRGHGGRMQCCINLVQHIFVCCLKTDDLWTIRRWLLKEMLEIQLSSRAHGNLSWSVWASVVHWSYAQRSQSKSGCNNQHQPNAVPNLTGLMVRDTYIWSSVWRTCPWSAILWNAPDTSSHTGPRTCHCSCKCHFEPSSSEHTFLFSYFYSQWEKWKFWKAL